MYRIGLFYFIFVFLAIKAHAQYEVDPQLIESMQEKYQAQKPKFFGYKNHPRILTKLDIGNSDEKVIALTFDSCGGSDGYDSKLIEFLIAENVPATLFINHRWIVKNPEIFEELSNNPLFQIENHGTQHRPLTVNGRVIYKIRGTRNVAEVVTEVESNANALRSLTGEKIAFFRAGTAYYDDVALEIINELGYGVAGFSILGDGGAKFSADKVKSQLVSGAEPGAVALLHMNRPGSGTRKGVELAVPILRDQMNYRFVKLNDYGMVP